MSYRGEKAEKMLLEYIKNNFDDQAESKGGMNSHDPDIISPKLGIIEVKGLPAQSGQFTQATATKYNFSDLIIDAFGTDVQDNAVLNDNDLCVKWIKDYYINTKKVNYFGVLEEDGTVHLQTPTEYFQTHTFYCTARCKKSGSDKARKWVMNYIPKEWNCYWDGDKLYAPGATPNDSCIGENTKKDKKIIWVNPSNEVRILSDTKNLTYIFSVK